MNPVQLMDKVFEPHGVSISGNGTLTENVYGFPHTWAGKYQEEWLKRMIAYWGNDLGAPDTVRSDVAFAPPMHEEYCRVDAGIFCLPPEVYVENGYSQGVMYGELETFFPAWQARANVPADKDKRVRLSYLMDFFAAELAEPDECWNKEHWDSLRPLEEEMEVLRKEVSPWGGDTRYEWDGKLSG